MTVAERSNWNLFLDRLIAVGPGLTQEEWRLAAVLMRDILGYRKTQEALGEDLLRRESGLSGWSFKRARDGLVRKGLIVYTPPGRRGRGHRGHYRLVLDGESVNDESPAGERDFQAAPVSPATAREIRAETPAESPAQTPAGERGCIEEGVKNDDDGGKESEENEDRDDQLAHLHLLLAGFDTPSGSQRELFLQAFLENQVGFAACVDAAREQARNPTAFLTDRIRANAHLTQPSVENGPRRDRLQGWLDGDGKRMTEETASIVLADSFGLVGDEHVDALRQWRERRARAATPIGYDEEHTGRTAFVDFDGAGVGGW